MYDKIWERLYFFHCRYYQDKYSKQRKRKPDVTFHRLSEDDSICPYKTLEHYLEFTKSCREEGDRNQLLINHSASTATVACSVKWVLGLVGISISFFKAHSIRAASTSKAKVMGLSTKDILKRRNCSREATWQKYYRKHILSYSKHFQEKMLQRGMLKQRPEYLGATYYVQEDWVWT